MEIRKYDYLIVGAGLFGATFAYEMTKFGKKCLVIDKRKTIAGNIYTEIKDKIHIHKYGAHIFHTSNKKIWDYINKFDEFNNYINSPIANYKGEIYNLPFNMNTFNKLWGVITPEEAKLKIESQKIKYEQPKNLEEQALSLVGTDIYKKLIKDYTEKQWGKNCDELPSLIIKRIPLRFTYNNNYFNDVYQGIPKNGYTEIINKMLKGIEVKLNTNYKENEKELKKLANKIIYTGAIDEYYGYKYGKLEYRTLKFEEEELQEEDFQGNAVVNYTSKNVKYTRIIEHKHFNKNEQINKTIITREYPETWNENKERYYPINDIKNNKLYEKYNEIAKKEKNIVFGGRLGLYKYLDMDDVISLSLELAMKEKLRA